MSKFRFDDRLPAYKRSMVNHLQTALREMGAETLRDSRRNAPFLKGALRGNADARFVNPLTMEVSHYVEYAHFQHEGGDKKRRVVNYSHGGGPKFLENAGKKQQARFESTVKKHLQRARV